MLTATLQAIKNGLRPLIAITEAYRATHCIRQHLLTAMLVELKNMCGDASHCINYSSKHDLDTIEKSYEWFKLVAEQQQLHFISYLVEEMGFIIDGVLMSQDYEDEYSMDMSDYKGIDMLGGTQ